MADLKSAFAPPLHLQADPSEFCAKYTLALYADTTLLATAELISVNPNAQVSSPLSPGKETWNVPSSFLSSLSQATKLVITGTAYRSDPGFSSSDTALFQVGGSASWSAQQGSFPSAAFYGTTSSEGLGVRLSLLTWTGSAWAGTITWYTTGSGPYAFSVSDSQITLTPTVPGSTSGWSAVTQEPSAV